MLTQDRDSLAGDVLGAFDFRRNLGLALFEHGAPYHRLALVSRHAGECAGEVHLGPFGYPLELIVVERHARNSDEHDRP
ncbi:MAG: hypothetical protein M3025_08560, partial [Actinomycetota bacterium]|nr:hypothetical protein [Actinomycetota bacterium]